MHHSYSPVGPKHMKKERRLTSNCSLWMLYNRIVNGGLCCCCSLQICLKIAHYLQWTWNVQQMYVSFSWASHHHHHHRHRTVVEGVAVVSNSETKLDIDKTLSLGFQEPCVYECVKWSVVGDHQKLDWGTEWLQLLHDHACVITDFCHAPLALPLTFACHADLLV